MSRVIADLYEIQNQIGSGGGGIVYLGSHLRLKKEIVLKADKRSLNAKPEMLRREVDMLKGLNHMYIPQVYDFVQEDGIVYTVMDFIDGESLDKRLERGEHILQPQVIRWACQLLEALVYLHGRSPYGILHGDIKPANIMVRPNGDICLIDYNIALALGEDGAVKAGYSLGYASPEHYGIEYKSGRTRARFGFNSKSRFGGGKHSVDERKVKRVTKLVESDQDNNFHSLKECKEDKKEQITLDARSDIYSLGATLYHLIAGYPPAEDARQVEPLGAGICSKQVAKIIQKAMDPNPDMRYQTADEMLDAFRHLHRRDERGIRHRRRAAVCAAMVSGIFLTGGACSVVGLRQMEQMQEALALAEYSSNSLAKGNVSEAIRQALKAIPEGDSIFDAPVTAQAQKALTDALGVYDLSEGFKPLDTMEFPSAPFGIQISPKGTRFAVLYSYEAVVFDTETLEMVAVLPLESSALSDVVFVDESHVVYAGKDGVSAYDLDARSILWTGQTATTLAVSADGTVVAAVNRDANHAEIYHMADGERMTDCSFDGQCMQVASNDIFADPGGSIFALNSDGTMLAVSFQGGGLRIFDLEAPEDDLYIFDSSDYMYFEGGFHEKYFSFAADGNKKAIFGLIDTEQGIYVGDFESSDRFILKADEKGIYLANRNILVDFNPDTFEETELAYTDQEKITAFSVGNGYVLTATDSPGFSFFDRGAGQMSWEGCEENWDFVALAGDCGILGNRDEPSVRLLKLEDHRDMLVLSYDARFPHDESRISQNRKTAMLFDYKSFCVYDMAGNILAQEELPEPEQIYDQQFRKSTEGSWLEVTWYDGTVRCYDAADGSLISQEKKGAPSKDLYEEFYTDDYKIASSLHGTPQVYDLESEQKVGELEKDAYLTYVTQVGEYIITEYISTTGEPYGLLLNDRLQTLARLPWLCDISDGMLVFDYGAGTLKQCPLYTLQELIILGKSFEKETS